jgi:hypothetical protein
MILASLRLSAVLPFFFVAALQVQSHPALSGEWLLVNSNPPTPGASTRLVIRQEGITFTIGHGSGLHASVYRADGKDAAATVGGVRSVTRAEWVGDSLVAERRDSYPGGLTRRVQQVFALGADDRLTIRFSDLTDPRAASVHTRTYVRQK